MNLFKLSASAKLISQNTVPILLFLLFGLFITITPNFDLIPSAFAYDQKRIFQLLLLTLTLSWLIFSRHALQLFIETLFSLPRLVRYGLITIFGLGLLSSLMAASTYHALLELSLFTLLFCYALTISLYWQLVGPVLLSILLVAILVSVISHEASFFAHYFAIISLHNDPNPRTLFTGYDHPRFFNQFQIWTFPLISLAILKFSRSSTLIRPLLYVMLTGWWTMLLATGGRGAALAIICSLLLTFIIFRQQSRALLKPQLIAAIGGVLLYLALFLQTPAHTYAISPYRLTTDSNRLLLWSDAIKLANESPILGAGPQHFSYYTSLMAAHPHNAILQFAAEWGIPVTLIVIALSFWGLFAWRKTYRSRTQEETEKQHLWIALFTSLLAGCGYAMVSGVIVMPMAQTLFAVIAGLMLGLYPFKNRDAHTISNSVLLTG
ncbi:MAG: O-antigen ligase family protein, partial [Gammaproteobacteria bacterium]|nr:O-antigen ligase family protein [Gammaproteobacteria bacterium]